MTEARKSWRARAALSARLVRGGYRGRHRLLAFLVGLTIAASVALAVSLEVASRSVGAHIDATQRALAGSTDLEIRAGETVIPESLLETVRETEGVAAADPITYERFRVADGPAAGAPLHVIGVDFLSPKPVHQVDYAAGQLDVPDPLRLVASPESLIVTDAFRKRTGVKIGDAIRVHGEQGPLEFRVRGFLEESGVGRAFGSQVAVTDVFALQSRLGLEGYLHVISVDVAPDADLAVVQQRLQSKMVGIASVVPAGSSLTSIRTTLDVIRLAMGIMTTMGIGVAVMLAYGTSTLSTQRRAREFALLRVGGVEARRVRAIVIGDGLLTGLLGTAVGLPAGVWLAGVTTHAFSGMLSMFSLGSVPPAPPTLSTGALAVAVGMAMSTLGAAVPATRAARARPLDTLLAARAVEPAAPTARAAALFGACAVSIGTAYGLDLPGVARVAIVALAGLVAIRIAVRAWLPRGFSALGPGLARVVPGVGHLVGVAIGARPLQAAVAVAAVAALLGCIGAIAIAISTLATTVDGWMGLRTTGAILRPNNPMTIGSEVIAAPTIERVRRVPGVRGVAGGHATMVLYRGLEVIVSGVDVQTTSRFGPVEAEGRDVTEELLAGEILISDTLVRKLGPPEDDAIELDTPGGRQRFGVAGVVPDYNPVPHILMDLATLHRHWPTPGPYALRVWTDEPAQPVLDAVLAAVEDVQPLFALDAEALSRWGSDVAAGFKDLLYVVSALVAGLGGVAVLNLLAGSVAERRREFTLLHAAGVSRRQLAAAVALDAFAIAALGAAFGLALALVLADPMIQCIEDVFAWNLTFHVPWSEVLAQAGGVVVLATAAGSLPVRGVGRCIDAEALAPE